MASKKVILFSNFILFFLFAHAQKVDSIYFHLYTDSLKKGTHNYINVDGKLSNGRWLPLSEKEIKFSSSIGTFEGNDLILPSDPGEEKVIVKAVLRSNTNIWKEITIWIKKKPDPDKLPTKEEIMNGNSLKDKRRNKYFFNTSFNQIFTPCFALSLQRQVLHDQLLLNLPRAGRQQG